MIPSNVAHILLPAIVAISVLLMLVRPRDIAEFWWISGGALLLIALRLVPLRLAGHAVAEGTNVYLFLIGMMLLSELAREQGVFDWLSFLAVRGAKGSRSRLFLLVYLVGAVVTIFMSNDATAVVLTPAILVVVRKAKIPPLPYLFVCALIANAASFVLPISNPANLVVFRTGMPPLGQWLLAFGLPSVLSIAATYAVLRVYFRNDLRESMESEMTPVALTAEGKVVLAGLGLMLAILLAASAMDKALGLPTCLAALAITAAVSVQSKSNPLKLFGEISWGTLLLVAGLFILVDAAESQGALRFTQEWLSWAQTLAPAAAALVVGFGVGIGNNLVNNLPATLMLIPVLAAHGHGAILAMLIGVNIGPNLTYVGSLATLLWRRVVHAEDADIELGEFLRLGALTVPAALLTATVLLWLGLQV